jgi:hypothetical protein
MKKILLVLVVVLAAFAATAQKTATVSAKSLEAARSTGKYTLVLPADITSEQVDNVKNYYVAYFTVNFNQMKHEAAITLTSNEQMNRTVIMRFLSSLGVRTVMIDGKEHTLDQFYEGYLK